MDVSEEGAKLRTGWKGTLPDAFDLQDIFSGVRRAVLIGWRGLSGTGVRFLDRRLDQKRPTGFGKRDTA